MDKKEKPIAWGCRVCNKIDWADSAEQMAKPEHVSHRGCDIGTCKGKMIPLYEAKEGENHGGEPATGISISQDQLNQKDLLINDPDFWRESAEYWRKTSFDKHDKIDQLKKENECLAQTVRDQEEEIKGYQKYDRAKEDLISAEELLEDRQRIIDRQRKLIGKHQSILKADLSQAQEGWVNQPVEESYDQRKRAVVYQKKDKDDTNIPVWVIPKEVK